MFLPKHFVFIIQPGPIGIDFNNTLHLFPNISKPLHGRHDYSVRCVQMWVHTLVKFPHDAVESLSLQEIVWIQRPHSSAWARGGGKIGSSWLSGVSFLRTRDSGEKIGNNTLSCKWKGFPLWIHATVFL